MAEPTPSVRPTAKVAASAIGGNVAAMLLWGWNQWQTLETCTPLGDVCKTTFGQYHVGDEMVYGLILANVAWLIGPAIRKFEALNGKSSTNANIEIVIQDVGTIKEDYQELKRVLVSLESRLGIDKKGDM